MKLGHKGFTLNLDSGSLCDSLAVMHAVFAAAGQCGKRDDNGMCGRTFISGGRLSH